MYAILLLLFCHVSKVTICVLTAINITCFWKIFKNGRKMSITSGQKSIIKPPDVVLDILLFDYAFEMSVN